MPESSKPDCFIGLDLGTSGCRAIAIDANKAVLCSNTTPLPAVERQTPGDWWQAVLQVLTRLNADLSEYHPTALAVDGTSTSLLLCDANNAPLSPVLMYNDTRARQQAASLQGIAPTDTPVHSPGDSLPKLLWLLEQQSIPASTRVCHQAEWVLAQMAERALPGDENNCLKLGYDPQTRQWPGWLNAMGFPDGLLPEIVPAGYPLTTVAADFAQKSGLPADCQLIAGTTDSTAAALATGISNPGDATTALGSALVLKILANQPIFCSQHGVYSHKIHDHWLVGGASNSGGAVLQQYFSDAEIHTLTPLLNPARSTGFQYYPLSKPGERFPENDPDFPPRIEPIPDDRVIFLQALLEGITRIEVSGYQLLQSLGCPPLRQITTTGGGSINEAWRQLRAKQFTVPVTNATHTEAAYGSALLARHGYLNN